MGKKIFLTTDETNFLNPNIGAFIPAFLPSVPKDQLPRLLRLALERLMYYKIPHKDGEVYHCQYGLRKIEAILLEAGFDCKVYSPQVIDNYADEAGVFGIASMDPIGMGPVTATLQGIFGNKIYNLTGNPKYYKPSYTEIKFKELIQKLKEYNKPIIVGGSGACQFDILPNVQDELGIDCIVIGDSELIAPKLFKDALEGKKLPKIVHCKPLSHNVKIPTIRKPVSHGLVEISRGCDRHCKFCDPSMKNFRWIPISNIIKEVKVNTRLNPVISLMSEDVFRYGTKPREWVPNWGLINLIKEIKRKVPRCKSIGLSHACLASALAAPEQIESLKDELNLTKWKYTSVQVGVETGSIRIISKYMPYKGAPFEPDQWQDVVVDGWKLLAKNYIYPAATLMIGLDDTEEDIQETISLMKRIMHYPGMFWPLFFSSLGNLKDKHRYFVDWDKMSPSARELYLLAVKYMLKQSEKVHAHLFGTSFFNRIINHIMTIFGKTLVDSIENGVYTKGHRNYRTLITLAIKNSILHSRYVLGLRGYKSEFIGEIEN
ncbi:MAG: B12-binding domain-containing radical SAM protein [Candidatus Helarchaeota archaeon]